MNRARLPEHDETNKKQRNLKKNEERYEVNDKDRRV